ncbi:MAG: hypothetical protein MUC60_17360 [Oscillatoria sp. Prado101]|nr:hypothetical protein [Oscillatoria sp. Prado101]
MPVCGGHGLATAAVPCLEAVGPSPLLLRRSRSLAPPFESGSSDGRVAGCYRGGAEAQLRTFWAEAQLRTFWAKAQLRTFWAEALLRTFWAKAQLRTFWAEALLRTFGLKPYYERS